MEKSLEQVKEFMLTFKQPVIGITDSIEMDRARLRLNLLFEELHELAIAYGEDRYFHDLCTNLISKPINTSSSNRVEQLDALVDIKYVLNGAVLESGFAECFEEAFEEVHNNNMTKAAGSTEEVIATIEKYSEQNRAVKVEEHNNRFIIFDKHTNKALKAANYVPVDLSDILNRFIAKASAQTSMDI